MTRVFTCKITVPQSAIDLYGHVNNIDYVRWMQEAATSHTASGGWTLERYRQSGFAWVVRRHTIDYFAPAFAGEQLDLHTWIEWIRDCQSLRHYILTRKEECRALVRAETLWVCVDCVTGRPKRVPEVFIEAFDLVTGGEQEALCLVGKRSGFSL